MDESHMAKKKKATKKATKKAPVKKGSSDKTGFANARVERLIRNAGAFRVSGEAIDSLNSVLSEECFKIAKIAAVLSEECFKIAKIAVEITTNSGRKTVKGEDIKLAASRL
ncbi:MAG: histone-like protein [Candidatus Hodarchaeales archaeon]|jgi:histone H3/H4